MKQEDIESLLDKIDDRATDFPQAGDDNKVSLRNSNYQLFPVEEAQDIKDNYLSIWREGGNIRGNRQFTILAPIARRGGNVETLEEENAVRRREAWAARHFEDYSLAGVVAQIKWLVVGSRGLDHMRSVIAEAKKNLENKAAVKVKISNAGMKYFEFINTPIKVGYKAIRVSPRPNESKDDFIARCMGSAVMVNEFADSGQRYAVCERYWTEGPQEGKLFENPCWSGYVAYGLKPDGSPNCIPEE